MSFLRHFNESYARAHDRRERGRAFRVAAAFLILVALFFAGKGALAPVMRDIAAPLWASAASMEAFSGIGAFFADRRALMEEREALRERIAEMEYRALYASVLENENTELRMLLSARKTENGITAKVLVRPDRSAYDTLVIDAGEDTGIAPGDLVLASGAIAFGTVREVGARTSLVELYSSPGRTTDITLTDGTVAVAEGRGGGVFIARVPHDAEVAVGDVVSLAQASAPVAFSKVGDIEAVPADPFKTLSFVNPVNLQTVRFVTIIHAPSR